MFKLYNVYQNGYLFYTLHSYLIDDGTHFRSPPVVSATFWGSHARATAHAAAAARDDDDAVRLHARFIRRCISRRAERATSSRTAPTGERFRGEFSHFQGLLDVARIDSFNHDVNVDDDVVVGDDWRACGAP